MAYLEMLPTKTRPRPSKILLAIDLDGHRVEAVFPECPPQRPEVIKIGYVACAFLTDAFDDLAVKAEAGYRGKKPAVNVSQVEHPDKTLLEGPGQDWKRLFKAQLVGQEIFGPARHNQHRLVTAHKSVGDLSYRAVASHDDHHRAVFIDGRGIGQLAGVVEGTRQICADVETPAGKVLLEPPAGQFLAGACAGFGIDYIGDISVIRFHNKEGYAL